MVFETLVWQVENQIGTLFLNRPEVLNAINAQMRRELNALFEQIEADTAVRTVIVTGQGDRAFAAGADVKEIQGFDAAGGMAMCREWHTLCRRLTHSSKPIIAAINGFALGGGCELALACDMRIAADTARLGQPEINLGIMPGAGGTQRLARLIGPGRALELLLLGQPVNAQTAFQWGLVNKVVPVAELMNTARDWAQAIVAKGAVAVRFIKEAVQRGMEMDLDQALALETAFFGVICDTQDKAEGLQAFLEKRPARFKGR